MMMMMIVSFVPFLAHRIIFDRLQYAIALLERCVAETRPWNFGQWQLRIWNTIEKIPQQC